MISCELCVCLVPEWNLPANRSPKQKTLSRNLCLQRWWWVINFQQSQDVRDWFWNVHHWNTEGLNMTLLQTPYLGQGGILSFGSVDSLLAFPSTLHRFCSFLCGWLYERVCVSFFCTSEPRRGRPVRVVAALWDGFAYFCLRETITLPFSLHLKSWKHGDESGLNFFYLTFLFSKEGAKYDTTEEQQASSSF